MASHETGPNCFSAKLWSWCVTGPTNLYLFRNRSQLKTKLKTQLGKFTFRSFIHHAPKNIDLNNICCKWKKTLYTVIKNLGNVKLTALILLEIQMTMLTISNDNTNCLLYTQFWNIKSTTPTLQLLGAEIFKMKMLLDLQGKQIGSKKVYDWLVFQLTTTCNVCKKNLQELQEIPTFTKSQHRWPLSSIGNHLCLSSAAHASKCENGSGWLKPYQSDPQGWHYGAYGAMGMVMGNGFCFPQIWRSKACFMYIP